MRLRAVFLQTSALVAGAMLIGADPARAADFDWIGANATYETSTNWNPNLANGPNQAGQSATFSGNGNSSIVVSGAATAPDAWTFSGATSYTISGANISFGGVGANINSGGAGLTNNATANQSISNNMRGATLNQAGSGTLTISGANLFTSISVSAGTLTNSGNLVATSLSNNASFNNTGTFGGGNLLNNAAGRATNTGFISSLN